jgi:hypothetical protein
MPLSKEAVEKINQRVNKEYPETTGCRPVISAEGNRFSLVYRVRVATPAGGMTRIIRVVADESGRVLRLSTSK